MAALGAHESELLLGIGLAVVAVALLEMLPRSILQDTWLALVAGREVATGGVPHHEVLTAFSAGSPWIDQQWLSQLVMYELYRAGGFALLGVLSMALLTSGIAGAVVGARKLGASAGSIIRVLPVVLFNILVATEVRTQAFAYPLFACTLYLLARDSRRPSPRVYWCLALLIMWGNLHGSATIGAGLVSLRGLTLLWERRRQLSVLRMWLRPVILGLGAPLSLLVTPYGLSMVSYYRGTLLNGDFRRLIPEWAPLTSGPLPVLIIFFALAAITIWSFGRYPRQSTLWDRCALLALAFAAVMVARNVEWFGIAALMLLPVSIDPAVRSRAHPVGSRPMLNLLLAATASMALITVSAITLSKGASAFERGYPDAAAAVVSAQLRDRPSLRVLADERLADWLLWRVPQLRGRVAYDARFELLSARQLGSIEDFNLQLGQGWHRAGRGYRLLVLPSSSRDLVETVEHEPGRRILYDGAGVVVILRNSAEASA